MAWHRCEVTGFDQDAFAGDAPTRWVGMQVLRRAQGQTCTGLIETEATRNAVQFDQDALCGAKSKFIAIKCK